eukprot:1373539-Prymnesium_polylepis.1
MQPSIIILRVVSLYPVRKTRACDAFWTTSTVAKIADQLFLAGARLAPLRARAILHTGQACATARFGRQH